MECFTKNDIPTKFRSHFTFRSSASPTAGLQSHLNCILLSTECSLNWCIKQYINRLNKHERDTYGNKYGNRNFSPTSFPTAKKNTDSWVTLLEKAISGATLKYFKFAGFLYFFKSCILQKSFCIKHCILTKSVAKSPIKDVPKKY